ncbi:MAG TPA: hypothetical protein V6D14_33840 [Coleofasciculaceae cyanobacterium]|jgi:DNA anti-recombination protein RmuC
MLHLAQVQNNESVGGLELKLLARQQAENSWVVINPENISFTNTASLKEGLLVLVDVSDNQEVMSIQNPKDWVLDIVQQYLTTGVSPAFLEEESMRTEQWRQDLTLQSQDLTRRNLEMEARREQIQTLEEDLKREKQRLEEMAAKLETKEQQWKREKHQLEQQLEQMTAQLNNKMDSEES